VFRRIHLNAVQVRKRTKRYVETTHYPKKVPSVLWHDIDVQHTTHAYHAIPCHMTCNNILLTPAVILRANHIHGRYTHTSLAHLRFIQLHASHELSCTISHICSVHYYILLEVRTSHTKPRVITQVNIIAQPTIHNTKRRFGKELTPSV
jgi:hypothetical protein